MTPTVFDASKQQARPDEDNHLPSHEHKGEHSKHVRGPDDYSEILSNSSETRNPFAAYAPKPTPFSFESQGSEEKVLMLLRRHPITNLPWIIAAVIMILGPSILLPMIPFQTALPAAYRMVLSLAWFLLVAAFILEQALDWLFNVYIITDERLVDTDFFSLIHKRVSEAKIDKIEDVTADTTGVLQSLLDYGTVSVQTAAEQREFEFEDIPHPTVVSKLLNELMLEEEREKLEGRVH